MASLDNESMPQGNVIDIFGAPYIHHRLHGINVDEQLEYFLRIGTCERDPKIRQDIYQRRLEQLISQLIISYPQ